MAEEQSPGTMRGGRPDPDPSLLTTANLQREITALKEQFAKDLAGDVKALTARLDAIDRATTVFQDNLTRVPTAVDKEIGQLKDVMTERFAAVEAKLEGMAQLKAEQFHAIQQQFEERDVRLSAQSKSSQTAVDAALQAAEKAVNKQTDAFALASAKSEAAFVKQIDQLIVLTQANTKALDDKISDAKDRLTRIEGQALGQGGARQEGHTSNSFVIAVIVAVISFIGLVIAMAGRFTAH